MTEDLANLSAQNETLKKEVETIQPLKQKLQVRDSLATSLLRISLRYISKCILIRGVLISVPLLHDIGGPGSGNHMTFLCEWACNVTTMILQLPA